MYSKVLQNEKQQMQTQMQVNVIVKRNYLQCYSATFCILVACKIVSSWGIQLNLLPITKALSTDLSIEKQDK